jgi:acetyl-CoA acyltransferase 1
MNIANQIRVGDIDIGIGGGVESMSLFSMQGVVNPEALSDLVFENEMAQKCMMSMGVTAENVAEKYGITR